MEPCCVCVHSMTHCVKLVAMLQHHQRQVEHGDTQHYSVARNLSWLLSCHDVALHTYCAGSEDVRILRGVEQGPAEWQKMQRGVVMQGQRGAFVPARTARWCQAAWFVRWHDCGMLAKSCATEWRSLRAVSGWLCQQHQSIGLDSSDCDMGYLWSNGLCHAWTRKVKCMQSWAGLSQHLQAGHASGDPVVWP